MLFEFLLFLFLIVTAGCAFVLALIWIKQRAINPPQSGDLAALRSESAALRSEVTGLRERVQTLEKIVTDSRYDLSKEIEAL